MNLSILVCALLLVLDDVLADRCPVLKQPVNINFSVSSRRDESGHWLVTVDAERAEKTYGSTQINSSEINTTVSLSSESCLDTEVTKLSTTLAFKPQRIKVSRVPSTEYELVNNVGYYKFHPKAATWFEARDKCFEEGGHLMIINSQKEADVLKKLLERERSKVIGPNPKDYVLVGFHDLDIEGHYVTVLGEPLNSTGYMKWGPGEPTTGEKYKCGRTNRDATLVPTLCDWDLAYICEFPIELTL